MTGWRIAALLLLAVPAAAQPAFRPAASSPRLQPVRDVVVTYRVEGQALANIPGGIHGPVHLYWDAAGQRLRAEAEGRSQVALIDLRLHTGQAFDTSLHIAMPLPIRAADLQPLTLQGARLSPRGTEVVAGLSCTAYVVETGKTPGAVCLTPDGVPLRGRGDIDGKPGAFTALSVSYGPLPPTLFTVPPGTIALGGGSPGGALGDLRTLGALLGRGGQ